MLASQLEEPNSTPAMAPLVCAADVTCRLAGTSSPSSSEGRERGVLDLERLREELLSAVHVILQMVRVISSYRCYFNKANSWYNLVLGENILHELQSAIDAVPLERRSVSGGTLSLWRLNWSTFLQKNPPPDTEELLHLARLSDVIPGPVLQQAGRQMSERCMILRNLLNSSAPVDAEDVELALQWQQELLQSGHLNVTGATDLQESHLTKHDNGKAVAHLSPTISEMISATSKSSAISAFDSGFDGDVSSRLEDLGGREGVDRPSRFLGTRDSVRRTLIRPQSQEAHINREESNPSSTKIQIVPKVTEDSLNFEIKLKLSSLQQCNPLQSLPASYLENSLPTTVTKDACSSANQSKESPVRPTNVETLSSIQPKRRRSRCWVQCSQSTLEYPEFSPIRDVLSSTITDSRDESCTTEGVQSLLWDSYDLHNHKQEVSDGHHQLSRWSSDDQLGVMSFNRLIDAADLGLEDSFDPADCDDLSEDTLTRPASETVSEHDEHCNEASTVHHWLTGPLTSVRPERKVFRLKLNGEKIEVKLEQMLHKGKQHRDRFGTVSLPVANSEAAQSKITLMCTFKLPQPAKKTETNPQEIWKELQISGENATICKPEASLIPERRPDDGVFDPGGKTVCPPLPVPSNDITKHTSPCPTELPNSALSVVAPYTGVEMHAFQNKLINTRRERMVPAGMRLVYRLTLAHVSETSTDGSQRTPTSENQTSSANECPVDLSAPLSPHEQSLKFDPGGSCLAPQDPDPLGFGPT